MDKHLEDQIDVCDDFSPFFEEESMPESIVHAELVWYLVAVLKWLLRDSLCAICEHFAFLPPLEQPGPSVAPDIAVIKGVALRPELTSWRVQTTGPAPHVVFEILSAETWKKDLEEKPDIYAHLGVHEYFAYDPTPSPLAVTRERLFGWRRDPLSGHMLALLPNEDGSLWSRELDSFLVPDKQMLRLSDRNRQLRLTEAEAEAAARQAAERRAEALAEKLRSLGVDPDQL